MKLFQNPPSPKPDPLRNNATKAYKLALTMAYKTGDKLILSKCLEVGETDYIGILRILLEQNHIDLLFILKEFGHVAATHFLKKDQSTSSE